MYLNQCEASGLLTLPSEEVHTGDVFEQLCDSAREIAQVGVNCAELYDLSAFPNTNTTNHLWRIIAITCDGLDKIPTNFFQPMRRIASHFEVKRSSPETTGAGRDSRVHVGSAGRHEHFRLRLIGSTSRVLSCGRCSHLPIPSKSPTSRKDMEYL